MPALLARPYCSGPALVLNKLSYHRIGTPRGSLLHVFFHEIHGYVADYGYAAIVIGLVVEHLGLPVPGETLLVTGAVLASRGTLDIWLLLPLAWFAAVIGNTIGYLIGRTGGHHLLVRHGDHFGITQERLTKVEGFVQRYGAIVLIFARFIVVARQLSGIVAGSLNMNWFRFTLYNVIGAALWVGFWGLSAYWLGKGIFEYLRGAAIMEPLLLALSGIGLAVAILYVIMRPRDKNGDDENGHGV
jgi:membrane protein DedA with SNARE-associated domain